MARATALVTKEFWNPTVLHEVPPDQNPHMISATKLYPLGTRLQIHERVWHYGSAGGSDLAAGKLCMNNLGPAADHIDMALDAAVSAGATTITITNGATTAIVANDHEDGYVFVNDGVTGEGQCFRIKSHPAAAVNVACVLTLWDEVIVALDSTATVTLHKNLFAACAINANEENIPAGVPNVPVTTLNYFWCQTWGPCAVWNSDTSARGYLMKPDGTAGKVAAVTATNDSDPDFPSIGWAMAETLDTEYRPVYLRIHP
jgi:hypothetical protein